MAVSVTTAPGSAGAVSSRSSGRSHALAEEWTLYAVVTASACIVIGLIWDISWHRTIGRDTFWSPPHLVEQAGAIVAGLSCGYLVLRTTFAGTNEERGRSVRFWKYFQGPLGAWVCIWGSLMMVASAPFDDWWHNAYGLDVKIISPPHVVLASGMIAIQLGAMVMAVGAQNRSDHGVDLRRMGTIFTFASALIVLMFVTTTMERAAYANTMHSSQFYITHAVTLPLFLAAFGRASRVSWPTTRIALVYMAIAALTVWILPLFPGTPRLAPIYNMVTQMVPPPFPLLLFAPALAIDVLLRRDSGEGDWKLAVQVGAAFVLVMLAVHWPWAEFMLSPASRNAFFSGDVWDYNARPGEWQYQFWQRDTFDGRWSLGLFAQRMAFAVIIATIMARLGLGFGKGLAKVKR